MKQFNPTWITKGIVYRQIRSTEVENKKKLYNWKRKHGFVRFAVTCSQCKRGMRGDIAKIQIENKRENAPICAACCFGFKRKPLIN